MREETLLTIFHFSTGPKYSFEVIYLAKIVMTKKMLKELHGLIGILQDEVIMYLKPDGIEFKVVDPAHVAMVNLRIPKEDLHEYVKDADEVSFDVTLLPKVYKRGEQGLVSLEWNQDDKADKVIMRYDIKDMPVTERRFCPDTTGMSRPHMPELKLPCKFTVNSGPMCAIVEYANEFVTDHIALESKMGEVHFSVEQDYGGFDAVLCPAPDNEHYRSLFPFDYFSLIVKASGFASMYNIDLGTNYPIRLHGRTNSGILFEFLLAPRLESE
jgi:proliferating cell nuclear antigen